MFPRRSCAQGRGRRLDASGSFPGWYEPPPGQVASKNPPCLPLNSAFYSVSNENQVIHLWSNHCVFGPCRGGIDFGGAWGGKVRGRHVGVPRSAESARCGRGHYHGQISKLRRSHGGQENG